MQQVYLEKIVRITRTNTTMIVQCALAATLLLSCGQRNANSDSGTNQTQQVETAAPTESVDNASVTIDGISQFVSWDLGAMKVTKDGDVFVLSDAIDNLKYYLKPVGDGIYQESSPTHNKIGQGEKFVAEKVGDITTLTVYQDKMVVLTLISADDLISYRNKAYRRILTSKFEPTENGTVSFTDNQLSGPVLPDNPDMNYFFIEDGNGDLTNKIRLSPGRSHLEFSPADKGVNLHFCNLNPSTGNLEPSYERDNTIILRYAKDPGWAWLGTDVLDAGFVIYNFDKPYWHIMLSKLEAAGNPNAVQQWNQKLIKNLIEYNEPYTGLASTDY